jgi:hypothetical protein
MRRLALAFAGAVVVACALGATGCASEACCLRPTTGLYDVCIAAAAPPPLEASAPPRSEVPPAPRRPRVP